MGPEENKVPPSSLDFLYLQPDCNKVGDCRMSTKTTKTVREEPVALCSTFLNQTR